MSEGEKKKESRTRARRRLSSINEKAGVAEVPGERLSPTLAMMDAALRLWEAKRNKGSNLSVWTRNSQKAAPDQPASSG